MDFAAQSKKGAGIARLLRPSFLYSFPRRPLLARSYSQRACRGLRYLLLFLLLLSPCSSPNLIRSKNSLISLFPSRASEDHTRNERAPRPLEKATIDTRRYALDKWMYPFFGDKLLVHNAAMKEFVNHIADLSPATIRDYVNIAKSVVASARDAEGPMLFPREWDDDSIDAPEIDDQKQPTVDKEGMEAILREAQEPYRTLYALLAGCGPMRAGEALGLDIRSIHPDCRTLDMVQKAERGELQD